MARVQTRHPPTNSSTETGFRWLMKPQGLKDRGLAEGRRGGRGDAPQGAVGRGLRVRFRGCFSAKEYFPSVGSPLAALLQVSAQSGAQVSALFATLLVRLLPTISGMPQDAIEGSIKAASLASAGPRKLPRQSLRLLPVYQTGPRSTTSHAAHSFAVADVEMPVPSELPCPFPWLTAHCCLAAPRPPPLNKTKVAPRPSSAERAPAAQSRAEDEKPASFSSSYSFSHGARPPGSDGAGPSASMRRMSQEEVEARMQERKAEWTQEQREREHQQAAREAIRDKVKRELSRVEAFTDLVMVSFFPDVSLARSPWLWASSKQLSRDGGCSFPVLSASTGNSSSPSPDKKQPCFRWFGLQVLKLFGYPCNGKEDVKRVFRNALIEMHPDKLTSATMEEAVRKEEMFKILMSKKHLL